MHYATIFPLMTIAWLKHNEMASRWSRSDGITSLPQYTPTRYACSVYIWYDWPCRFCNLDMTQIINTVYYIYFSGALVVSVISSPAVFVMHLCHVPKVYGLLAGAVNNLAHVFLHVVSVFVAILMFFYFALLVRIVLGSIILMTLRLLRVQVFLFTSCSV